MGMLEGLLKFKDSIKNFKEANIGDIEKIKKMILEIDPCNCNEEKFEGSVQKIKDQMKVIFFLEGILKRI